MNTGINEKTLKIIKDIIGKYNVEKRFIFGSRARGTYRYNSDIDIAIFGTINRNDFNRLLDELMESDCIYKIVYIIIVYWCLKKRTMDRLKNI